jgi:hypothetical protein
MTVAGRTLSEYFVVSRKFLVIVFILALISVVGRLSGYYPPAMQYLLLLGLVALGWAGWTSVRVHKFTLVQTGIVGFLVSFGSHWSLPIFHGIGEFLYLFLVNSAIFVAIAIFGGFLARKTRRS